MKQKTVDTDWMVKAELKRRTKLERVQKQIDREEDRLCMIEAQVRYLKGEHSTIEQTPLEDWVGNRSILARILMTPLTWVSVATVTIAVLSAMFLSDVTGLITVGVAFTVFAFFGLRAIKLHEEASSGSYIPLGMMVSIFSCLVSAVTMNLPKDFGVPTMSLAVGLNVLVFGVLWSVFAIRGWHERKAVKVAEIKESLNLN